MPARAAARQARGTDPGLTTYRAKRDFARTSEPAGAATAAVGRSFVVNKHDARRLHYDLRLELDGVLVSWAVTRGPSYRPGERRLAVRTEDHPLDYGRFEGTIPKGEYGGGTVMLWDRGSWTPLHDPHEGLASGHLHFLLDGTRLRGAWSLVRMTGRSNEEARENWLLLKGKDAFAVADGEGGPSDDAAHSLATGRTMAEIARGAPARDARIAPTRPRTRGAPPDSMPFQLATPAPAPPEGEEWLFEIKHDGYRVQVALGGTARIWTRGGHDWTDRMGPLVTPCLALGLRGALLDGEVVILDDTGRSDFKALQAALQEPEPPLVFFAFDLLRLDGKDLTGRPLVERRERLAAVLASAGGKGPVLLSDHVAGDGAAFLAAARAHGLEGIIAKRASAPYRPGPSQDWLKIKAIRREELVIGGWMPSSVTGRAFSSLLLGWHDEDGRLLYAGRVGTGFDDRRMQDLAARLARLARERPPFASVPGEVRGRARWVRPELVAEVAFTEITRDGRLRHPSFQALRADKPARAVTRPAGAP